jgi:hypothetical protein
VCLPAAEEMSAVAAWVKRLPCAGRPSVPLATDALEPVHVAAIQRAQAALRRYASHPDERTHARTHAVTHRYIDMCASMSTDTGNDGVWGEGGNGLQAAHECARPFSGMPGAHQRLCGARGRPGPVRRGCLRVVQCMLYGDVRVFMCVCVCV